MANRYLPAARRAAQLTNKQLGERLAQIGPMRDDELRKLLPRKKDKVAFAQLMAMVEQETDEQLQLNYLADNMHTAGRVALKALKFFV